jgi:hypothetical protein
MKHLLPSVALALLSSLASVASEPGDGFVAKLDRIVIPRIEFDQVSVEEAIDFVRMRCFELDPEPEPARRGISFLTKRPKQADKNEAPNPVPSSSAESIKITYSAKAVPILVVLAEVARQAHLDIYLTEVGIVICQIGEPPFPNAKAEKGEVWKTIYKATEKKGRSDGKPEATRPPH